MAESVAHRVIRNLSRHPSPKSPPRERERSSGAEGSPGRRQQVAKELTPPRSSIRLDTQPRKSHQGVSAEMRSSRRIPQNNADSKHITTSQREWRFGGWKGIPLIRRAGNRTPKVEPDPKQGIYNGTFRRISGRSYSVTNHKEMD